MSKHNDHLDAYVSSLLHKCLAGPIFIPDTKEGEYPMNIKEAFMRVFKGHDPIDFIQDFVLETSIDSDQIVHATMSVPAYGIYGLSNSKKHTVGGRSIPQLPKRIIFSGPKTIVFWHDGTKTIVSCAEDEEYDPYNAFCAAVVKKMFGTTSAAKSFLHKHSEYHAPKEKKSKPEEFEGVEYQVNCDVDIMEAEIVPVYEEECRSSPIEYDNCVGDYSKEDC